MRRQSHPPPVYAIADADVLAPTPVASGVARMAEAGLRWIQVRAKSLSDRELYDQLERSPEVDLVALGPIFSTGSKREPDPVVGLERLRRARGKTFKPLVAIGGIDAQRVPEVLAAGADSVAVLAAVCRGDVVANCRRLLESAKACR